MTQKNSNTLLYTGMLILFILLFFFTGSSETVEKQLTTASADTSMSEAELIKKLKLKPYDELQQEIASLQAKVNDTTDVLYFKRNAKTVQIQLVKADDTTIPTLEITLDETDSYNFNTTFTSLETLTQSNIGNVILTPASKWTESKYASAKFPSLLGWNPEFSETFKTLRSKKVTQNTAQVSANTTKSIHFFLWSTIEYLKAENQNAIQYVITKNGDNYTIASEFYTFDHKAPRIDHKNDSLQQLKTFKENLKNAAEQRFTFAHNGDMLTLTAKDETIDIPIRSSDAMSLTTIGKISPGMEESAKKILASILTNLTKADASITDWTQNQYNKANFAKALDLSIRDSRWKQFVAVNKAEDVFDFLIETITFQLDETPANAITLKANTISNETTSTMASVENSLTTTLLLIVGILTSLFLLVREQFFTQNIPVTITETKIVPKVDDKKVVEPQKQVVTVKTKTEDEIIQQKINSINSLQEVSKLPWKSAIEKELTFLINNEATYKKLASAKAQKTADFLNTLKEIFPEQANELASHKEAAELWNEFSAIRDTNALKKFLKRHKGLSKILPKLLEIGLHYEAFDNANTLPEALKSINEEKKFAKDIDVLLKLKETYPTASIEEIITATLASNATLRNNTDTANSVVELVQHLNTWYAAASNRDSKWKPVLDDIAKKQQSIQQEHKASDKLSSIEAAYNLIFTQSEHNTEKLLRLVEEEKQKLKHESQQQIEAIKDASAKKIENVQQEAAHQIDNIKAQAKQAYEDLEASKKTADNNNKLAEKFFANLYDPHIKELENKARDLDHAELTKRIAFIAFNAMDLAKFVNDDWSADKQTEGNIRRILRRESLGEVPKENYDPNTATSYINIIVAFLHKNGVKEVEHLIDGIDINEELKGLH